jgi:hypothetical protein
MEEHMTEKSSVPGNDGAPTGVPGWVKVSGIIAGAVIVLLAAMLIFGGGNHGPGRHMGGLGATGSPAAAAVHVAQA